MHTHRKRAGMTQVLMSGRKDERLFLCPWPLPCCSATSASFTLKYTVTGQQQHSTKPLLSCTEKNGFLTKTTSLSEEVMQRLKSITLMEWTQQKQIADTKINRGNVWLHSKLVPFLFLHSTCYCFIFCAFLCVLSPPDHSIYSFQNRKTYSIFSISFYHLFTLVWNFQALPPHFFSHLIYLVSWKIFSSLLLTGHV